MPEPEPSPVKIWLASASPRRSQLLTMLGVPFERVASTFDEPDPTPDDHARPYVYVMNLASSKARAARWSGGPAPPNWKSSRHIILSADTVVWHEGTILNKPSDEAEAQAMLRKLCGSRHTVLTGFCLRTFPLFDDDDESERPYETVVEGFEETHVQFAPRDENWIARYVATGEPMDKAGAYAAQGLGSLLIERIEGDFFNVVGLPLFLLSEMLRAQGVAIEGFWESPSNGAGSGRRL